MVSSRTVISKKNRPTILLISDHPNLPSGVGRMANAIVSNTTHRFNWVVIGGNIGEQVPFQPHDFSAKYGDDSNVIIYPHMNFGSKNIIRYLMNQHSLDGILHFNDPHNFYWLYEMEDEIRREIPLMYYHVWDNLPVPEFNKSYYESCDWIGCISKLTYHVINQLHTNKSHDYIPHGTDPSVFYPIREDMTKKRDWNGSTVLEYEVVENIRNDMLDAEDKYVVFWNNRNLQRKRGADVIRSFAEFVRFFDPSKHENFILLMKTNPNEPSGPNLYDVVESFASGLDVRFINKTISDVELNWYYNVADVTINISSREGFGLSTLESIMAGTPIISNVTGGLQDQMGFKNYSGSYLDIVNYTSDDGWGSNSDQRYGSHGIWCHPVYPITSISSGSQQQSYCFDDIVDPENVADALRHFYFMGRDRLQTMGMKGRTFLMRDDVGMTEEAMAKRFIKSIEETISNFEPKEKYKLIKC